MSPPSLRRVRPHRRSRPRRGLALASVSVGLTIAAALGLASCSGEEPSDPDVLVVGVRDDSPGLSVEQSDGTYAGLDVDFARYLARGLGYADDEVRFETVSASQTQRALRDGEVDMVMSLTIDPIGDAPDDQPPDVELAGPYLDAGQDLLVPTDSLITGALSLGTRRVCGVKGSDDLARVREPDRAPDIEYEQAADLASCVREVLAGRVDAVTGDDVALAGYARMAPNRLRVVGSPFTNEYYTVGLPPDSDDVADIDALLQRAIDDGTWEQLVEDNLVAPGFPVPLPPSPGTAP